MNGKRVGLYLRVSTGEQTVENQREALVAACGHRGWRIVEEFVDNGISGAKGRSRRPGFDRLLKAATRRKIEAAASAAGCTGPMLLRRGKNGHAFVTDGGHWIVDASFGRIADPGALAKALDGIPGVVEHGLFIGLAHAAVLAGSDGVRVIERH